MLIQIDWMWNWNKTGVRLGAGWVLLSNCHLMQHGPQLELDNFLMCGTMWLSNVSNELAMLLLCLQDLPRSWMQTLEAIAAPPHWVWEELWKKMRAAVGRLSTAPCSAVRISRRVTGWTTGPRDDVQQFPLVAYFYASQVIPCAGRIMMIMHDHGWSCGMPEIFHDFPSMI